MKTLAEFEEFRQIELGGYLYELEGKRRALSKSLTRMIMVCAALLVAGFGAGLALAGLTPGTVVLGVAPPTLVSLIWWAAYIKPARNAFVYEFKRKIIRAIVKFIDENLEYHSTRRVSQGRFMQSTIFRTAPDRYKGEDYVSGTVEGTQIEFSEIHAEYVTRDSKNRKTTHTIFRGLFLVADFPKKFNGTTVVLPDVAQKMLGFIGQTLQKWNLLRGDLVKLEDPEFEKEFVVYGDDQIEARYILTTSMMERLMEFRKKALRRTHAGNGIHLAFTGGKIFVAIDCNRDLFEPKLFTSNDDSGVLRDYFDTMSMAIGIVEDLKLNPRFK
jgi:hypothetical protein